MVIQARNKSAMASCALLVLTSCNGELQVVDDLEGGPDDSNHGNTSGEPPELTPVPNSICGCATSPYLMPSACTGQSVALLESDVVPITPDGSVAAFTLWSERTGFQMVYWRAGEPAMALGEGVVSGLSASGEQVLGVAPGGNLQLIDLSAGTTHLEMVSIAGRRALSADGDTVIGAVAGSYRLARAHVSTGQIESVEMPGLSVVRAYATPDASTVVGYAADDGATAYYPFRWSSEGLTLPLADVPAERMLWPEAVSSNGAIVAGTALTNGAVFRWSELGGYREIGLPSTRESRALISANGLVIVGNMNPDDGVYRWAATTGVSSNLTQGVAATAIDMSDDAQVIVAASWEGARGDILSLNDIYIVESSHTRTLAAVLQNHSADTTGWEFGAPRAISRDGKVLFGVGFCGGEQTLYRAVIGSLYE